MSRDINNCYISTVCDEIYAVNSKQSEFCTGWQSSLGKQFDCINFCRLKELLIIR